MKRFKSRFKMCLSIILCLSLLVGCSSSKPKKTASNTTEFIKFYTIYNNLAVLHGTNLVINNSIDIFKDNDIWGNFESKNFNGVNLPSVFLGSDTALICLKVFPAKPELVVQSYIDYIKLQGDTITIYVDVTGVRYVPHLDPEQYPPYNLILATIHNSQLPKQLKTKIELEG